MLGPTLNANPGMICLRFLGKDIRSMVEEALSRRLTIPYVNLKYIKGSLC